MPKKLRVAVICGGRSGEHEVSLVSAESVMHAMNPKKYTIVPIGIAKSGRWFTGKNVIAALKKGTTVGCTEVFPSFNPQQPGLYILEKKNARRIPIDVAFPVLHGTYGEDGTIQGFFELAGIPYVGCGVGASAACMDKVTTKKILQAHRVPQVRFLACTRSEVKKNAATLARRIANELGFPCFVKPARLGSSVGISKVKKTSGLKKALRHAASFDSYIIVEEGLDAREIECAVLGNENPRVSIAGEIVPSREFYDYYAKYVDNSSALFIPARITPGQTKQAQALATQAYTALQCSGMARVDFLMEKKTGKFFVNEINTIPGFTSISMYPKLLGASGIPYSRLIDTLITLAQERAREQQKNRTSFESGSDWFKKS